MKKGALLILVFAAVMPVARRAGAVDKTVFKCEDKAGGAVNKWGAARGKCLVQCQQARAKEGDTSTRVCAPADAGFPDTTTAACITKADGKYRDGVGKVCPAGTIPACAGYTDFAPNDAAGYANAQIAAQGALIDSTTVPLLMCPVASDPDVAATLKCEGKVVGALAKLSGGITKCLGKCYAAQQLKADASKQCTPDATGDPFDTLDGSTSGCVTGAIAKATASINSACAPLPNCGLYALGLPMVLDLVTGNVGGNYADPTKNPYCAQ